MAKVSELKERARALEQQGSLTEALAIYRHILNHLERTPAIKQELPLYVKVGDLSLKLGNPTWAIQMYERAAGHYVQTGSAKTIISLCLKIVRVDQTRVGIFREYADRLVAGGQLQAAVAVLQEQARQVKMPQVFVRLQGVVDRPDEEARRAITEALAEFDGKPAPAAAPPAAAPPARPAAPAAPAPPAVGAAPGVAAPPPAAKAPIGLITEPQFDAGPRARPVPPHQEPVAPVDVPAAKVPPVPPAPPPEPPLVRTPPPLELEPGPLAPPRVERAAPRASGPPRASDADREAPLRKPGPPPLPESPARPRPPTRTFEPERRPAARIVTDTAPRGGRAVVPEKGRRPRRAVWVGAGAAVVVVAGLAVAWIVFAGRGTEPTGPTMPPESAVTAVPTPVPQPPGTVTQAPPADSGRAIPGPGADTSRAATPPAAQPAAQVPAPTPARVRAPPAPVTVQLPEGASITGVFVVIGGLPIDSASEVVTDGRTGHRVVQRLQTGEAVVLTAVPIPPGTDSVGLGEPQVMNMFGEVVGIRRYWTWQVNVRGSVAEDALSRLLGRLVRARAAP